MGDLLKKLNLWDECMIKSFGKITWMEKGMESVEDIILDKTPILFK